MERPYGTAAQIRVLRESTVWGLRVYNGKHREAFDPGAVSAWSDATTYSIGNRVYIDYADWSGVTTYALNDFVTGSDGFAYRSIQASNLNKDPISSSNRAWWRRVDFEYYEAILGSNLNKTPETFNANATDSGDRYWQRVYFDEAAVDLNEDQFGATFGDQNNAIDFYGLDVRNCDHKTLLRIDTNNSNGACRSIVFVKPHLHYIGANYITNISDVYSYGQAVQDLGIGADIGKATNIAFIEPEMQAAEVSEAYNCFRLGAKGSIKTCTLINIHGGIVDGDAPDAIGVHVMPSMTANSNRNMINTRFSLGGTNYSEVMDPAEKTIYKFVPKIEIPELIVVDKDDPTQFCKFIAGQGTPEATETAEPASLYLRRNALAGLIAYLKESGTSNTNWFPIAILRGGTTANRPAGVSTTGHRGFGYWPFLHIPPKRSIPQFSGYRSS